MFTSIFILILLLPAACLPLALDTFFSSSDLDEMGISLESSDDMLPIQGYELVGFLPASSPCEAWATNEPIYIGQ
jgi:hypothetical protein